MNIQSRKSKLIFGALLSAIFLSLLFQNCAQQSFTSSNDAPSYTSGPQKISWPSGVVANSQVCVNSQIQCYKKVYSPEVSDSKFVSQECTHLNSQDICYELVTYNYDTKSALATCPDCDASAALPNGRYNREEYTCWVRVPSLNSAVFYAVRSSLNAALTDALNSCLDSLPVQGEQ